MRIVSNWNQIEYLHSSSVVVQKSTGFTIFVFLNRYRLGWLLPISKFLYMQYTSNRKRIALIKLKMEEIVSKIKCGFFQRLLKLYSPINLSILLRQYQFSDRTLSWLMTPYNDIRYKLVALWGKSSTFLISCASSPCCFYQFFLFWNFYIKGSISYFENSSIWRIEQA